MAGGCEKGVGLGPLADPEKGRNPADCLGLYKVDEVASGVLAGGRAHRVSCSPLRMADGSIRPASACAAAGSINRAEEIDALLLWHVRSSEVLYHVARFHHEHLARLVLSCLAARCCHAQLDHIEVKVMRQISQTLAYLDALDFLGVEVDFGHDVLTIFSELLDLEASHHSLHTLLFVQKLSQNL